VNREYEIPLRCTRTGMTTTTIQTDMLADYSSPKGISGLSRRLSHIRISRSSHIGISHSSYIGINGISPLIPFGIWIGISPVPIVTSFIPPIGVSNIVVPYKNNTIIPPPLIRLKTTPILGVQSASLGSPCKIRKSFQPSGFVDTR
jgi:hypothetical protein